MWKLLIFSFYLFLEAKGPCPLFLTLKEISLLSIPSLSLLDQKKGKEALLLTRHFQLLLPYSFIGNQPTLLANPTPS
jgi:hypothetical protein